MKVQIETNEIESTGVLSEDHYGISTEDQAWILNILRSQLYSNKILAPIREYSVNAQDANIEANKPDTPIEVHIPSLLQNKFTVRDYGFGLSEQEIYETYSKYGKSTKRQSNAFTGQIGIGSKSAFAYTDSFTIVSWFEGTKYTYNAHIDETRMGKISLMKREPSNAPSGIEISFIVRNPDIQLFTQEAKLFFSTFEPKPKINTTLPGALITEYQGKNWKLLSSNQLFTGYSKYDRITARMGRICYPIQKEFLTDITDDIAELIELPLFIDFEIGDIAVAASREALEYTQQTRLAIYSKLKSIKKELTKEYGDKLIANCKTIWDAINKIKTITSDDKIHHKFKNFRDVILLTALRNKFSEIPNISNADSLITRTVTKKLPVILKNKLSVVDQNTVKAWAHNSYWREMPKNVAYSVIDSDPDNYKFSSIPYFCVLIIANNETDTNRRLYTLSNELSVKHNTNSLSLLIIRTEEKATNQQKIPGAIDQQNIKLLKSKLVEGTPTYYLNDYIPSTSIKEQVSTSSTPAAPSGPVGPSAYAKAKVTKYNNGLWKPAEIIDDPNIENIALIVSNRKPYILDPNGELQAAYSKIRCLEELDPNIDILGIKKAQWERMNKKFDITPIQDKIHTLIDDKIQNITTEEKEYIWIKTILFNSPDYQKYFNWFSINNNNKPFIINISDSDALDDYYDNLIKQAGSNLFSRELEKSRTAITILNTLLEKYDITTAHKMDELVKLLKQGNIKLDAKYYIEYTDILDLITELDTNTTFNWVFLSTIPPNIQGIHNLIQSKALDIILDIANKI